MGNQGRRTLALNDQPVLSQVTRAPFGGLHEVVYGNPIE